MTESKLPCYVCGWRDRDPVLFGDFITASNVNSHYLCMLTGTNIPQTSKVTRPPLLGFTASDVLDSKIFYEGVNCYYCGKRSAAINCSVEGCGRSFHYSCGHRNSCITVFQGEHLSYCNRHVPDQNEGKRHSNKFCSVCFERLQTYHPANSIIGSCCLKLDDWEDCFVHKTCVMNYVKNAGYDSRCITCPMEGLTKADWQQEMRSKGIFVPQEVAAWEKDGRFADHSKQRCEMPNCKKPAIRKDVYTCFVCGCFPRHLNCAQVETFEDYLCPKCWDQSFVQRVPRL